MPIVTILRLLLRGRVRAQIRYGVILLSIFLKDYLRNAKLPIFAPGTGFGSKAHAEGLLNWWIAALLATG